MSARDNKTSLPGPDGQMRSFGKTTFGNVAGVFANGLYALGDDGDVRAAGGGGGGGGGGGHDGVAQRPRLYANAENAK